MIKDHGLGAGNQHRFPCAEGGGTVGKSPKMAPVDQYLMERNAEILLALSAAPDSISSDTTIMVLGRQGDETAIRGKNGLSVWWKEAGWRRLTRLSSGTRR
jgi:hypothetical protein